MGPPGRRRAASSCRTGGAPTPVCSRPPTTSARPVLAPSFGGYGDQGALTFDRRSRRRASPTPSPTARPSRWRRVGADSGRPPAYAPSTGPCTPGSRRERVGPSVQRRGTGALVRPRPRGRPPGPGPRRDPPPPSRRRGGRRTRASPTPPRDELDVPVVGLPGDVPATPDADRRTVAPRPVRAGSAAAVPGPRRRRRRARLHDRRRRRVGGGDGAGPAARAAGRDRAPERVPVRRRPPDRPGVSADVVWVPAAPRARTDRTRSPPSTSDGTSRARSAASTASPARGDRTPTAPGWRVLLVGAGGTGLDVGAWRTATAPPGWRVVIAGTPDGGAARDHERRARSTTSRPLLRRPTSWSRAPGGARSPTPSPRCPPRRRPRAPPVRRAGGPGRCPRRRRARRRPPALADAGRARRPRRRGRASARRPWARVLRRPRRRAGGGADRRGACRP